MFESNETDLQVLAIKTYQWNQEWFVVIKDILKNFTK